METFDVIVVGAGPAGEVAAGRCADRGMSVALVEREPVGGECSYWGCIPSKTLIRPGDVVTAARRVPGAAEAVTGTIDVSAALAQRDYLTSSWKDEGQLPWLAEHHITLVRGSGRLDGAREVVVESTTGPARRLRADRAVVLATGTKPVLPPIPGLADAHPWDNCNVTAIKHVPPRFVVLGGGAVGVEMAQALRRLGSEEVTVIEVFRRLLGREEPFAGEEVGQRWRPRVPPSSPAPRCRGSSGRHPTPRSPSSWPTAGPSSATSCWSPPGPAGDGSPRAGDRRPDPGQAGGGRRPDAGGRRARR